MGDRGQIKIKDSGVYLYAHWRGMELPFVLQAALAKRWRWDDAEYLTRIIFDAMVADEQGTETSFGIGTSKHADIEHPLLVVDCAEQKVHVVPMHADWDTPDPEVPSVSYSFEEYVNLPADKIKELAE